MKTQYLPTPLPSLLAAFGVTVAAMSALGQAPVISSLSQNGQLVCTNLLPGSTASVEWASSPAGPWTNTWAGLHAVTVDSNGMIQVSVPMFYRVRGTPPPPSMAFIPAGTFQMGDNLDGDSGANPLHTVNVSAFWMDKYEVTKALWDDVYQWATNHGYGFEYGAQGKAENHPAHSVTWFDAVKWCNARSEKEGLVPTYYTSAAQTTVYRSGEIAVDASWVKWNRGYRLPTEAEWEMAARGGTSGHRFPWSDVETITHSQASYYSSSNFPYDVSPTRGDHPAFAVGGFPYTSPVGYFAANGYRLYDMAGNIYEWCWDWYGPYSSGAQTDPHGPTSGGGGVPLRVRRGGNWYGGAINCRVAGRNNYNATARYDGLGFRSVRSPGQ